MQATTMPLSKNAELQQRGCAHTRFGGHTTECARACTLSVSVPGCPAADAMLSLIKLTTNRQSRRFSAMSLSERLSQPTVDEAKRNGIPAALFIEDVADFLAREKQSAEEAIYFLQDLHRKYKFLERRLLANKGQLKGKIPDILQSLDAVRMLKSSQDSEEGLVSNFQLCESLYVTARIKKQQHIGLWLGANVMMEYTLDEAEDLLSSNLATAQASLIEVDTGLSFCREQLTTTEVNIARVYNYDVQLRRQVTWHGAACAFLSTH
jgi:prefoldin subunit 5